MRQFDPIRRSTIAGTWYPADRQTLVDEVDAHLAAAGVASDLDTGGMDVSALIAPARRAGLLRACCGPCVSDRGWADL